MPRIDQEPYADELTRPQPMGRIWKLCLEPYRTGGLQDLIVDKREFAFIELDLAVLAVGKNRKLAPWPVVAEFPGDWSPAV